MTGRPSTQEECLDWMRLLASRRRFGERDRRGTAHLIDDDARSRAVTSMRSGDAISLGRPLVPVASIRGDGLPGFQMNRYRAAIGFLDVGTDHVELDCHGSASTHLDAFNHVGLDDTWYSGWGIDEMDACGVDEFAIRPVFTRGVLADIPGARGTDWVEPDEPVGGDDIDKALAQAGVEFQPGDALLLYMGRDKWEAQYGVYAPYEDDAPATTPGVGHAGTEWIVQHDASVLCWDFQDAHHPSEPQISAHVLIWSIGLLVVDSCDFSRVIPVARQRRQFVGAFTVAPLLIDGATGCTVNPTLIV